MLPMKSSFIFSNAATLKLVRQADGMSISRCEQCVKSTFGQLNWTVCTLSLSIKVLWCFKTKSKSGD